MTRKPHIPMSPSELPQQRLYLLKGMPKPPAGWAPLDPQALGELAKLKMPRSARYLGQVEWAWSPMHSRVSSYYLSMDRERRHWLLWVRPYDDNWGRWDDPWVIAAAPRSGLDGRSAGKLLLVHHWNLEREDGLDQFHWVNEACLLTAGEFNEIGEAAWGDKQDDGGEDNDEDDDRDGANVEE